MPSCLGASGSVRTKQNKNWDAGGVEGEFGWGGAASTHYWMSPKHELVVITMRQFMPYQWTLEFGLKGLIYDAIEN